MHCPQKLRSIGGPQGSIMSVKTVPSRTHEPNLRVISWQWRPIQPIYVFQIKIDLIPHLKLHILTNALTTCQGNSPLDYFLFSYSPGFVMRFFLFISRITPSL
jgi:hypothetical protein